MAGYLFQPERALLHLARSPRGALVGIETLDDVSVQFPDGRQLREQDKHYTAKGIPLADRSKALWNSLNIWLDAIESEGLDLQATEFHLVTNQKLKSGIASDLMKLSDNEAARLAFVKKLRKAGKKPPEKLAEIFNAVLARSDIQLAAMIARIRVFDSTKATHGEALRKELHDHLHLHPAYGDEIIHGLSGWVDDVVLGLIRDGKPAWIARDAFSEVYRRLNFRYQDVRFINETAEALIPVADEERAKQQNSLFVKQLHWVGVREDDEQLIEAIDAHIRAGTETRRLAQAGTVTPADFRAFEDRLVTKWKGLWRLHVPNPLPPSEAEKMRVGYALLNQTLNHRESLAGQPTTEFYLTQGAYHRLADAPPRLGWHPQYQKKAEKTDAKKEPSDATGNGS